MLKITRKDEDFFLRTYQKGDEEKIITLINESLGINETLAHWQWKYITNPTGSLIILVTDKKGTIIGHIGLQRKRGVYYGVEYNFFISIDVAVTAPYRGYGLFGSSPLLLPSEKFIILGFPNSEALYSYKKFPPEYAQNFFFVDVPVFTKTLRLISRVHHLWSKREDSIQIVELKPIELDVLTNLWEKKKQELTTSVIRDAQYLKWRVCDCPQEITLYEIRINNCCIGYLSIVVKEKICFIIDIIVLNAHLTPVLIESMEDLAYSLGASVIQLMINDGSIISLLLQEGYAVREKITCTHLNTIEKGKHFVSYITYSDTDLF